LVNIPWDQTETDAEWVAQGWDWIDPEKDVNATKEELKSGIKTFQQICSEAGLDWQTQIDNMSTVQDYAKTKGVTLDFLVPEQPLGGDTQGAKGSADG
jgi:capsid protein